MNTDDLAEHLQSLIDGLSLQESAPLLILEALTQATVHAANKNSPHYAALHLDAAAAVLSAAAKTIRESQLVKPLAYPLRAKEKPMEQASPSEFDFAVLKVLLVEDNDFVRALISKFLTRYGVKEIFDAIDGAEAIAMLPKNPDIIISDIHMNPTDGLHLLKHVRALPTAQNMTPFIIFTSNADSELIRKAKELGVDSYLLKPVTVSTLKIHIIAVMTGHAT